MNLKIIKNDKQLNEAFERIDLLWDAKNNTPERDELEVLSLLIEKYEEEHFSISSSEAVEAIKFLMKKNNLKQQGLPVLATDLKPVLETLH